jgi:LytS/YehU family sensor histidine kinase
VATTVIVYVVASTIKGQSFTENLTPLKLNLIYGALINLLYHLLHAVFVYFEKYNMKNDEAEALRKNNAEARMQLIKNQINPHFLFNNLNVLSGMVIKDNPEANRFIEEFSKVYRYILSNQDKEVVALHTELEFLQPYLYLFKTRFENGLKVDIDIPEHYKNRYIVPAALQMLIENAIKHNIVRQSNPLNIQIKVLGDAGLSVRNNIQLRLQSGESSKIGLQNITMRYQALSNKDVIIHNTDDTFEVILPLLQIG